MRWLCSECMVRVPLGFKNGDGKERQLHYLCFMHHWTTTTTSTQMNWLRTRVYFKIKHSSLHPGSHPQSQFQFAFRFARLVFFTVLSLSPPPAVFTHLNHIRFTVHIYSSKQPPTTETAIPNQSRISISLRPPNEMIPISSTISRTRPDFF